MPPEIITLISVACTILGAAVGVFGFVRLSRKDTVDRGKADGALLTDVGYIKAGIDDLKRRDDRRDQQHIETVTRLTAVEESAKQAHKRIDGLEK